VKLPIVIGVITSSNYLLTFFVNQINFILFFTIKKNQSLLGVTLLLKLISLLFSFVEKSNQKRQAKNMLNPTLEKQRFLHSVALY